MKELENNNSERCKFSQPVKDESNWSERLMGDKHFVYISELRGQNAGGALNVQEKVDLYKTTFGAAATSDISFKLGDDSYTVKERLLQTSISKSNSKGAAELEPESEEYTRVADVFKQIKHDFYHTNECE